MLYYLSKFFDTISYDLLFEKLDAYGSGEDTLDLVYSYVKNRKQRAKINTTFSNVPQGSILGPLLFNIYLNDLFFFLQDINICDFFADTTPFVCNETFKSVLDKLERNSELVIFWFETNYMKLNTDKYHLLFSGTKYENSWAKIGDDQIWKSNKVNLLGVTIDNKLKFDNHIANFSFKANQNLSKLKSKS